MNRWPLFIRSITCVTFQQILVLCMQNIFRLSTENPAYDLVVGQCIEHSSLFYLVLKASTEILFFNNQLTHFTNTNIYAQVDNTLGWIKPCCIIMIAWFILEKIQIQPSSRALKTRVNNVVLITCAFLPLLCHMWDKVTRKKRIVPFITTYTNQWRGSSSSVRMWIKN